MRDIDRGERIGAGDEQPLADRQPRQSAPRAQHRKAAFQTLEVEVFDRRTQALFIGRSRTKAMEKQQ
jgi:hypothetical protein